MLKAKYHYINSIPFRFEFKKENSFRPCGIIEMPNGLSDLEKIHNEYIMNMSILQMRQQFKITKFNQEKTDAQEKKDERQKGNG